MPQIVIPGAQANFETWGGLNQCTGSPAALPEAQGCEAYPMCGGDVDTVLCTIENGTHCGSYATFDIANVAWRMLERTTL